MSDFGPDKENPVFKHSSPFLHGNYAPTHLEVVEEKLQVEGRLSHQLRRAFIAQRRRREWFARPLLPKWAEPTL